MTKAKQTEIALAQAMKRLTDCQSAVVKSASWHAELVDELRDALADVSEKNKEMVAANRVPE